MIIKPQTDADKYLADLARYHESFPSGKISQRLAMLFSTKAGFSFAKRWHLLFGRVGPPSRAAQARRASRPNKMSVPVCVVCG